MGNGLIYISPSIFFLKLLLQEIYRPNSQAFFAAAAMKELKMARL